MEKQNESMRERLLARLPQPENLAAYREETASLLAKHEKALFWEKMPSTVCSVSAIAILMADWFWGQKTGAAMSQFVWSGRPLDFCRCTCRSEVPDRSKQGGHAERSKAGSVADTRAPGFSSKAWLRDAGLSRAGTALRYAVEGYGVWARLELPA